MYYIGISGTSAVKLLLMAGDSTIVKSVSRNTLSVFQGRVGPSRIELVQYWKAGRALHGIDKSQVAGIDLAARCTGWWFWMRKTGL